MIGRVIKGVRWWLRTMLSSERGFTCASCGLYVEARDLPPGWERIDANHVCHDYDIGCPETCPTCGASLDLEMYPDEGPAEYAAHEAAGRSASDPGLCPTCKRGVMRTG